MTQTESIYRHLLNHGSITPLEALNLYGCMRLGARIWDLRRAGMGIRKTMESRKNADGQLKTYARYTLEGSHED